MNLLLYLLLFILVFHISAFLKNNPLNNLINLSNQCLTFELMLNSYCRFHLIKKNSRVSFFILIAINLIFLIFLELFSFTLYYLCPIMSLLLMIYLILFFHFSYFLLSILETILVLLFSFSSIF